MFYIQENDKPTIVEKIIRKLTVERNKIIIPINETTNEKVQEKLARKTIKLIKKSNSKKIIISKKIQNCESFIKILEKEDLKIVDGKWLYKMLIPEITDYILEKENLKKEETSIHILVNNETDIAIQNIKKFSTEFKAITIITNHIDKFKRIEEKIYNELGINITVMNNKKKGLSRAKIIINYDFPKELINQYNINEKAIIVNIQGKLKINKKRYDGKIIQGYEIKDNTENEYDIENEKFYTRELYESTFYYEQPYKYVREKIEKDKIKIKELYLQNGSY